MLMESSSGSKMLLLIAVFFATGNAADFYLGFYKNNVGNANQFVFLMTSENESVFYSVEAPAINFYSNGTFSNGKVAVIQFSLDIEVSSLEDQNHGIYVHTSSDKVTLLGQTTIRHVSSDTFTGIPTRKLPVTEYVYYGISVPKATIHNYPHNSSILIVGTENNTKLKLNITQAVTIGLNSGIYSLLEGVQYKFIINRLQTVYLRSLEDLTGSRIEADKPVSVFSGHGCANLPDDKCCCSHQIEQIPPTFNWGKKFYTAPLADRQSHIVKILAAYPSTEVTLYCNKNVYNLNIDAGNVITKACIGGIYCAIHSSKEVLVAQYSLGYRDDDITGDPMMTLVPAVKHYSSKLVYSTMRTPSLANYRHYINIIVTAQYFQPTEIFLTLRNSVIPIGSQFTWKAINGSNGTIEAYAKLFIIPEGVEQIYHTDKNALLTYMVYGFARVDGYGHPASLDFNTADNNILPPNITLHPKSQKIELSNDLAEVTFSCDAIGATSYKWRKLNGGVILGATTNILTLNRLQLNDAGRYQCVAINNNGVKASHFATLTIIVLRPKITKPPSSKHVDIAQTATFTCSATGYNVSYQWRIGSGSFPSKVTGINSNILVIPDVKSSDDNTYTCVASNEGGSVSSNAAKLTVTGLPVVTVAPSNQSVEVTRTARFSAMASGIRMKNFIYQWEMAGHNITGETGYVLKIHNVSVGYFIYRCYVSNEFGDSAVSNPVELIGTRHLPLFTLHPHNKTVVLTNGTTSYSLSCNAIGASSYHWEKKNGNIQSNIIGMNTNTITFINLRLSNAGLYQCVATNDSGSSKSYYAKLIIDDATEPIIITHPNNITVNAYGNAKFTCKVRSFDAVHITWMKVGQARLPATARIRKRKPVGATSSSVLIISKVHIYYSGVYYCIAKNRFGTVISHPGSLFVKVQPPEILVPPQNTTIKVGDTAQFVCFAISQGSLMYQWTRRDNTTLPLSAKSSSTTIVQGTGHKLVITNVQHVDNGWYCCVAINQQNATKDCAWLEVNGISISLQPKSGTFRAEDKLLKVLFCLNTGKMPIYYQWQKYDSVNDNWIKPSHRAVNVASPDLVFNVITEEDEGIYRCIATNIDGSISTNNATITVYSPPMVHLNSVTVSYESGKASLVCNATNDADAVNSLQIKWYNPNGVQIKPDKTRILIYDVIDKENDQIQSILLFDPLNRTDNGNYTCQAMNDPQSYTEATTTLIVQYAPQLTMLPTHSVYHVRVNTSLQLVCIAEGYPIPSVRWYKNGIPVTYYKQSFHTLHVSSKVLNSTEYKCEGINHIGISSHIKKATIMIKTEKGCYPLLQAPAKGEKVDITPASYNYVKYIVFFCQSGYKLQGSYLAECKEGGIWSILPPTCV